MKYTNRITAVLAAGLAAFAFTPASAQQTSDSSPEDEADLAQDLTNPMADLVSIPVQMNYDQNFGPADNGWKLQTNIQPVYPIQLNDDWNLITRTIVPVISQDELFPGAGSQFGLGDVNMSLFFSPRAP